MLMDGFGRAREWDRKDGVCGNACALEHGDAWFGNTNNLW